MPYLDALNHSIYLSKKCQIGVKEKNEIMSLTHTWYYQDYIDLLHQYNGLKMQLRMHAQSRSNVFDEATRYWETLQNMDYKEMYQHPLPAEEDEIYRLKRNLRTSNDPYVDARLQHLQHNSVVYNEKEQIEIDRYIVRVKRRLRRLYKQYNPDAQPELTTWWAFYRTCVYIANSVFVRQQYDGGSHNRFATQYQVDKKQTMYRLLK